MGMIAVRIQILTAMWFIAPRSRVKISELMKFYVLVRILSLVKKYFAIIDC